MSIYSLSARPTFPSLDSTTITQFYSVISLLLQSQHFSIRIHDLYFTNLAVDNLCFVCLALTPSGPQAPQPHQRWAIQPILLLLLSRFSRVRLCDFRDGSPPGSPNPGILQTSTLEWVAIPFSRGPSTPGTERRSPTLQADSFHRGHQGSPSRSREAWKLDSLRILSFSRFTLRSRTVVLKMINQSKILVEPDQNIRPFQGFYTSGKIQVIDCE